jgi:biotin transport system substrate-specific component
MRLKIRDMTMIAFFTVLAIIGGRLVIPVTLIPFTLQTAVCFLTGILLGSKRALLAQALYLLLGLAGLPVFAAGGGPGYVLQPSFGYLPGMLLAAGLIGHLTERAEKHGRPLTRPAAFFYNAASLVLIYACGTGYLYILRNFFTDNSLSWLRTMQLGLLPYLLTDTAMAVAVAGLAPYLRRISQRYIS